MDLWILGGFLAAAAISAFVIFKIGKRTADNERKEAERRASDAARKIDDRINAQSAKTNREELGRWTRD